MTELINVLKDIKTGALPVSEIPGFLAWAFRKIAWLCIFVIASGALVLLATHAGG